MHTWWTGKAHDTLVIYGITLNKSLQLPAQSQLCHLLRCTELVFSLSKEVTAESQDRQCGKGPPE